MMISPSHFPTMETHLKGTLMITLTILLSILALLIVGVAIHDLVQKKDPILRNYPVVGHGRKVLSELGPKLRQYIVADNNEERPFNRDDREWVYHSADKTNNYFGFGTDNDIRGSRGYLIIKQNTFPLFDPQPDDEGYDPNYTINCAKVLGQARGRKGAFTPNSIINISAMSYGSLSSRAVEAMSRGAAISGCLQNTGEGGVSPHHDHGSNLVWQLGTGYYGARASDGKFDEKRFVENCDKYNVKAIEVKISQGAKPGRGGVLPGEKVTPEIAAIRGIPVGKSCLSPNAHRMFSNADEMLDFVERIAELSGLPVGIKSAVGQLDFWHELSALMESGNRGIDFLAIDGGEGGTGAAPLTFSDHVSLPFKLGFDRVHKIFAEAGLADQLVFIGSGKLGLPEETLLSMAMGCDMINVARTAMLAIGCIQAQICHTGKCPTGVATQNKWLMRGLDPTDKGARLANYITVLRKEVLQLCRACGVAHPSEVKMDHFERIDNGIRSRPVLDRLN